MAPDKMSSTGYSIGMVRRSAILLGVLLSLPSAAQAQGVVINTPAVAQSLHNSAVVGIAAVRKTIRSQTGMSTLANGFRGSFGMLEGPLGSAFSAAQRFEAYVKAHTVRVFTAQAGIFTYRPSAKIISVAKDFNMPKTPARDYDGNLIGRRRNRSDFYLSTDEFNLSALEAELALHEPIDNGALAANHRAALTKLSRRIVRTGGADANRIEEASHTFDGRVNTTITN